MATWQPPGPQQHTSYIGGVRVTMPVKPYPCQKSMMSQIILGLKRRQNCLLESPTGSGKSLSILCATLAWQREELEKARRYNALVDQGVTDPDVLARAAGLPPPPRPTPSTPQAPRPPVAAPSATATSTPNPVASGGGFFFENDDGDFRSQEPSFRVPEMGEFEPMDLDESLNLAGPAGARARPARMRVPKIFLGTRTHKQVDQIVKELRRTVYANDIKMVPLASRELTCIHPIVSTSSNKNEQCQELIDPIMGVSCSYHHGVNRVKTHDQLAQCGGLQGAWDIEDLVRMGHRVKACPYFTARTLLPTAELVICPYNYLVDPLIRKSMDISLQNHVLVLDEAHNIEDFAREAASRTVTLEEITEARNHLEQRTTKMEDCQKLASMLSRLSGWMNDNIDNLTSCTEYGRSQKTFTGTEIIAELDQLEIGRESYEGLQECHRSVVDENDPEVEARLSAVAKKVLGDFFLVYQYLLIDNMKYKDDYRVALIKEQVRKPRMKQDGWISKWSALRVEYSINFWCLNPAVVFSPISTVTHNIILTSGTLSPTTSFESELGVSFRLHLEANHVIDKNQIFVGSVGHGPRGRPLKTTFQNTDTWEFQDELGELVLNVCQTVPGGILCFLPSYALLNKLYERWQGTGLWNEIGKVKEAMVEQRKGAEFEKDMNHFYTTVRNAQMEEAGAISGVFFMAVFRGKVSEGLDFTDDNARAVIAVGIPYPYFKDIQVILKMKYNDSLTRSRKLLSGKEWYDIQAYRAINQALGRCIRHRYDWGALILVDLRFQEDRFTRGLSKWVRNKLVHHRNFSSAINSLGGFVKCMVANPPLPPKRDVEVLLATSHVCASNHSTVPHERSCSSLEASKSSQASSADENYTPKPLTEPCQSISTSESLRGNTSFLRHKEDNAIKEKKELPSQKIPWCGSSSCEFSKENNDLSVQGEKRAPAAIDDTDLDDFNLALSPYTCRARNSSPPLKKKVGQKKHI